MASYERTYGTARAIFSLLEVVSWLVAVGGVIAVFAGLVGMSDTRSAFEASMAAGVLFSGVFFVLTGLMSVAFVQSSRANVDQAEMSRDMLALMRKEGRPQNVVAAVTGKSAPEATRYSDVGALMKVYKGFNIVRHEDGVSVSGSVFSGILEAEKFIDGMK